MSISVDKDLVRNLTDMQDETLLSTDDLKGLVDSAKDHVQNDPDLNDSSQTEKNEAAVLWTCRLVAMKMRGASAVKSDDNLELEDPKHYKQEYQDLKENGRHSSDIMMRSG